MKTMEENSNHTREKILSNSNKNDIIFKKPKYGIEQKYKIGK